jgi:hypothetical protein
MVQATKSSNQQAAAGIGQSFVKRVELSNASSLLLVVISILWCHPDCALIAAGSCWLLLQV